MKDIPCPNPHNQILSQILQDPIPITSLYKPNSTNDSTSSEDNLDPTSSHVILSSQNLLHIHCPLYISISSLSPALPCSSINTPTILYNVFPPKLFPLQEAPHPPPTPRPFSPHSMSRCNRKHCLDGNYQWSSLDLHLCELPTTTNTLMLLEMGLMRHALTFYMHINGERVFVMI